MEISGFTKDKENQSPFLIKQNGRSHQKFEKKANNGIVVKT